MKLSQLTQSGKLTVAQAILVQATITQKPVRTGITNHVQP